MRVCVFFETIEYITSSRILGLDTVGESASFKHLRFERTDETLTLTKSTNNK
jgi:hypothetical protein